MSARGRKFIGAVALAAAVIGLAGTTIATAPRAHASERLADKRLPATVKSITQDADGNLLTVTVGSDTAAWRDWLATSQGSNVWLSVSLGVHFPGDKGSVVSTSGDDAVIGLAVPGKLSFTPAAGQTLTVWAE